MHNDILDLSDPRQLPAFCCVVEIPWTAYNSGRKAAINIHQLMTSASENIKNIADYLIRV